MSMKEDFYGHGAGRKEKLEEAEKEIEDILLKKGGEELKKQSKKSKISFRNWFKSLITPAEVFREEKNNANLIGAVKNVGVSAGLVLVVMYVLILGSIFGITLIFGGGKGLIDIIGKGLMSGIMVVSVITILFSIIFIIIFLIESGILFLFAKIFGGKGSFTTQTYLISLPYAALIWIGVVTSFILSMNPIIVYIYALYPVAMALKESHNYSTIKAGLTLLPAILFIILLIISSILL